MKHKLATTIFVLSLILTSMYALSRPSYDLSLFVSLSTAAARVRILTAGILCSYVFVPFIRFKLLQILIASAGLLALITGVSVIFSPMLFGQLSHYVALGDVLIIIEGGVLGLLSGLQLPRKHVDKRHPLFTPKYYAYQISKFQPQKLLPAPNASSPSGWTSHKPAAI